MPEIVRLSPLDTERFGVETARLDTLTSASLKPAVDFCEDRGVDLLITNCQVAERAAFHEAESQGFSVMDTIVVVERPLAGPVPPIDGSVDIRPAHEGEGEAIIALARVAFAAYVSHYHADPRLDAGAAAEVYPDWTRRLLERRDEDHEVLVAESDGMIVGFHAIERSGDHMAQPLSAVRPGIQGKHVYQSMNARGIAWGIERGAKTVDGKIQLANTPIQRALCRLGYLPIGAYFTLHKWFD